jgi:hypothetical protein
MSLARRSVRGSAPRAASTFVLALGTALASTAGCVDDPPKYSNYDRLSARADECGPVRVTVRGKVRQMLAPGVFRVTDAALFADGIWVLSLSQIHVTPEQYVIAHGMLQPGPPEVLEARYGVRLDGPMREAVAREGLFVAESMAAFPAGPPG